LRPLCRQANLPPCHTLPALCFLIRCTLSFRAGRNYSGYAVVPEAGTAEEHSVHAPPPTAAFRTRPYSRGSLPGGRTAWEPHRSVQPSHCYRTTPPRTFTARHRYPSARCRRAFGFNAPALHLGRAVGAPCRPNRDTFRYTTAWPLRCGPLPDACRTGCIGAHRERFERWLLHGDGPAQVGFDLRLCASPPLRSRDLTVFD
jgi:hypothetical protein